MHDILITNLYMDPERQKSSRFLLFTLDVAKYFYYHFRHISSGSVLFNFVLLKQSDCRIQFMTLSINSGR